MLITTAALVPSLIAAGPLLDVDGEGMTIPAVENEQLAGAWPSRTTKASATACSSSPCDRGKFGTRRRTYDLSLSPGTGTEKVQVCGGRRSEGTPPPLK